MNKTESITVDLGEYGSHTLDFNKSFDSTDLEKALRTQPANYDWYNSIYCRLKTRLDSKHNYLKETIAKRRESISESENKIRDKKVSQKELDSLVEKDPEVLTVKEDINSLNYQVSRVNGHLTALSQFHSILKELSKRERSSMLHHSDYDEEDVTQKALDRVDKRGRKSREKTSV